MHQDIGGVWPPISKTCEGQASSETDDEQPWQKLLLTPIQSPQQSREVLLYGKPHAIPTASVNTVGLQQEISKIHRAKGVLQHPEKHFTIMKNN